MKTSAEACLPLLDQVRPRDGDGALHAVLLSTYGLSLDDPPFFDQDFLPTLLGLGGVRGRGYSAPATIERALGQIYCGMVCDAHAVAQGGRPSLRIDVIPIGHQLQHAKVILIHRERLIRLIIASANLTHEGFRRNREIAAVLDFQEGSGLPPALLDGFALDWSARIGAGITAGFQGALREAVAAAKRWPSSPSRSGVPTVRLVWGGGASPLWQQIAEAWPAGEVLREWTICSPFWPEPGGTTPFEILAQALDARGACVAGARLQILAPADVPGPKGRPRFPFALVQELARRGFRPREGVILPVHLDALAEEVPEGRAEDQRPLHAKWILLRGDHTTVLLLGSANFTRRGLGVGNPGRANIEAGVLLSGSTASLQVDRILPPLVVGGEVNWLECRAAELAEAELEQEDLPWPASLLGVELAVHWELMPEPTGVLFIQLAGDGREPFSALCETSETLVPLTVGTPSPNGLCLAHLSGREVAALLAKRRVVVQWGTPGQKAFFPLNIRGESKAGLPAVLGQLPTEQDLLAYFHGRIGEEDLMALLLERARAPEAGAASHTWEPPGGELQNYVVREFLEGLYGMEELLRASTSSARIFEQALLGEFSPVRLAQETQKAFTLRRRTPTATAFQLTELLRLVENLQPPGPAPPWLAGIRARALEQLLSIVTTAAVREDFRASVRAPAFREFVRAVLSTPLAERWEIALRERTPTPAIP